MSDTAIFLVGLFTSLLLFGGLAFTVYDVRKLGREADAASGIGTDQPVNEARTALFNSN